MIVVAVVSVVFTRSQRGGERVTAVFQQAYGLVDGGQVVIGGVPAGTIGSVELGNDGLPHVTMQLDNGVRLHQGARADLRQLSNSGELNRYVLLDPGSGPDLRDGAVIPSTQTAEPVEIDQLLNTLDPQTRADVRAVIRSLDTASVDLAPDFRAALRHSAEAFQETAGMLREVTLDTGALRTLVRQGAAVSSALARERPALAATVDQLAGLLAATARRRNELSAAITQLPGGLREPRLALDRLRSAVPTLRTLVRATAPAALQLRPTAEQLIPVLRGARPALAEVLALTQSAPGYLGELAPLLPKLRATLMRMAPVLRYSLPVLDYLRVYTPDLTGLIANWSATNSTYDAAGHGARILSSSVAPPGTAQPAASGAPGYLDPPFLRAPGSAGGDPWTSYSSSFLSPTWDR